MASATARRGAGSSWTVVPGEAPPAAGRGDPGNGAECPGSRPAAAPCGAAAGPGGWRAAGAA
eukprot:13523856-Alexandrium_andersonii.AAC.1